MLASSERRFVRGDERRLWRRYRASMRPTGSHQEMFDRAAVVAEDAALAHAEPSALRDDDAARLQRPGGLVDRLAAARCADVRVSRSQPLPQPTDPGLAIPAAD